MERETNVYGTFREDETKAPSGYSWRLSLVPRGPVQKLAVCKCRCFNADISRWIYLDQSLQLCGETGGIYNSPKSMTK